MQLDWAVQQFVTYAAVFSNLQINECNLSILFTMKSAKNTHITEINLQLQNNLILHLSPALLIPLVVG